MYVSWLPIAAIDCFSSLDTTRNRVAHTGQHCFETTAIHGNKVDAAILSPCGTPPRFMPSCDKRYKLRKAISQCHILPNPPSNASFQETSQSLLKRILSLRELV